jgi:hypothetical protein
VINILSGHSSAAMGEAFQKLPVSRTFSILFAGKLHFAGQVVSLFYCG